MHRAPVRRHTTANRIMQEDKPIMHRKLWTTAALLLILGLLLSACTAPAAVPGADSGAATAAAEGGLGSARHTRHRTGDLC